MNRYSYIIVFMTLLLGLNLMAEDRKIPIKKPDIEKIRTETLNPSSNYYYPNLVKLYEKNDTSMTLEEYRYYYLGTMFQEDYNPYRKSSWSKEWEDLYFKENHTRAELDTIVAYAELALADDPFDLDQMNYIIYALRGKGKNHTANIWQYRLKHILMAILSTGTGLDADNAWYVINPRHEYNIINFQNRVVESQQFDPPYFEKINLVPTGKDTKQPSSYFFNIHHLLEEYYRKYPEQL